MKIKEFQIRPSHLLLAIGLVLFVVVVPYVTSGYSMMVVNLALIYAVSTYGVSVMLGLGGQLSFAATAFMGVGAYFAANLCSGRWGFWLDPFLTLLLTPVFAGVVAFVLGLILLRLKGTYFTFATVGLVQVAWCFYLNYRPLFGGPDGISGVSSIRIFGWSPSSYNEWFYLLAVIVLLVALFVERVRRTQLGRSLAAVRDNEVAAQTLGINVYMTKVIAFTIAGILAAIAGALYAMHSQFVSSDMFTFERSTTYIIMGMLGGINNTAGIFVGSVLVTLLPEWLRSLEQYLQLIYGVGVILLMIFMPMGLSGLASGICKRLRRLLGKANTQQKEESK